MAEDHPLHNIELPPDIDLDSLQNILPDTSLTSPSPESIVSLYRLLLAQVEEADAIQRVLEEARAEAEKKDVELDQALQDRESQTKDLETSLDTLQSELKEVKQERDQLGTCFNYFFYFVWLILHTASSRAALQAQINTLSTSQSTSSTEVDTLKHRVEDTEREKRDLVGVVSRLKEDSAQREGSSSSKVMF
jgi:nucleoprotein TPR